MHMFTSSGGLEYAGSEMARLIGMWMEVPTKDAITRVNARCVHSIDSKLNERRIRLPYLPAQASSMPRS